VPDNVRPMRGRSRPGGPKVRMTGQERRLQLVGIGRRLFAERGYEATSIEEISHQAGVSKPVVYEHFGGKEGLYAVVVDRETERLLTKITESLVGSDPRELVEQAANALLSYIEEEPDGFRILVRDSPVAQTSGTFASLIVDIVGQVEHLLAAEFEARGYDPKLAPLYSQALVGMVALVGQWWLDARKPSREQVAAHLVNLAWNGLSHLESDPLPRMTRRNRRRTAQEAGSEPPRRLPGTGGNSA
jgi:AcrR family transcriptional regulator